MKQKSTKELVRKALKNKPKWKLPKGYKYLKDIQIGNLIQLNNGTKAVLLSITPSSAQVLVISSPNNNGDYYTGKHLWSLETEVKEIG